MFGAEFFAMKIGIDILHAIQHKLRMMGIPISGPVYVYGDNMSVIPSISKPESTIKTCNAVAHHAMSLLQSENH